MEKYCVSKQEASKLLGTTLRMVTNYLKNGDLKEHHRENKKVMIDVLEVYILRENISKRKRGKKND